MKKFITSYWLIICISLLFGLIKLPFLDKTFLLYDERDMALTQYSLAKTGNDLHGNRFPIHFKGISPQAPFLSMYYGVLFWKILPTHLSVPLARFPFILPTFFVPLLVFELVYFFIKNRKTALLTSIIFCFSPWVFHISQLGLEINLAFPFFLLALNFQARKKYVLTLLFISLTFFMYQGIRPLIFCTFIYFELWNLIQKEKAKTIFFRIGIFLLFFTTLFFMSGKLENSIQTRGTSEIVFFAHDRITKEVNELRSIGNPPLYIASKFDNKLTLVLDYLLGNIFQGINYSYLFKTGDYSLIYSNGVTGQFYSLFIVFFILGFLELGRRDKKEYYLVALFSLIGLTSSIVNIYSTTFSIRSLFSGIGFSFIIAVGGIWGYRFARHQKKIVTYALFIVFGFILTFQTCKFFYKYDYLRTVSQSEQFHEYERKLGQFLTKQKGTYRVVSVNPFSNFLSYIFFYPLHASDLLQIQRVLGKNSNSFIFKNQNFSLCNVGNVELKSIPSSLIIDELCLSPKTKKYIQMLTPTSYESIRYSDINLLRSGDGVKFYIFK